MSVISIDHGKKYKPAIIFPCSNCGLHNFISFQRIEINNHNCVQKAKCQICKFECPEQSRSFYQESFVPSKRYKKISKQDKRTMPLLWKIMIIRIKRHWKAASNIGTTGKSYWSFPYIAVINTPLTYKKRSHALIAYKKRSRA